MNFFIKHLITLKLRLLRLNIVTIKNILKISAILQLKS